MESVAGRLDGLRRSLTKETSVGYKFKMTDQDALYIIDRQSQPQKPPPHHHEIDPAKHYPVQLSPSWGSLGNCRVEALDDATWLGELLDLEVSFPPEDLVFRPHFLMGEDAVARLQTVTAYSK